MIIELILVLEIVEIYILTISRSLDQYDYGSYYKLVRLVELTFYLGSCFQ